MKINYCLPVCLLFAGTGVSVNAQDSKITVPGISPIAAAAPSSFSDEQILQTWGWYLAQNNGVATLNFSKAEVDSIAKGMALASAQNPPPYDMQKIGPEVEKFLQKRQETVMAVLKEKGMKDTAAFLADVKKKPGVITLPDGLSYEILKQGDGPAPKPTQTVSVHYTGTLINGTKFDSSVDRGTPAEFVLSEVIPGWTEGLQKISKGGKMKLYVPPQLAYGDDGQRGIPPASTLIFDVELLDIKDTPAAPAAPAAGGMDPAAMKK